MNRRAASGSRPRSRVKTLLATRSAADSGRAIETRITTMRRTNTDGHDGYGLCDRDRGLCAAQETNTAPASGRYLPEYTEEGDLILPYRLLDD